MATVRCLPRVKQTGSEMETLLPPSSICSSHFESKASRILTVHAHAHMIHSLYVSFTFSSHWKPTINHVIVTEDPASLSRLATLSRNANFKVPRLALSYFTESLFWHRNINHYHHLRSIPPAIIRLPSTQNNIQLDHHPLSHTKWSTARSNLFHSTTSSKLVCRHAPHRLEHAANNIQGRKQRRHEQLAQDIFGKNRRQSAPAAGNIRNAPLGGSLASRVGVNKVCSIQ